MSANKNLSLFIPFVFPNFDQKYVANAFAKVGNVERVDFVAKQDRAGKTYNAVYVHFNKWYNNKLAKHIYEECFEKKGQTQFYHDGTEYFWIVLPNTAKKHVPGERKPKISLGNINAINVKSIEKEEPEKKKPVNEKEKTTYFDENEENWSDEVEEEHLELLRAPIEDWDEMDAVIGAEIEAEMEAEDKKMELEDKNLISIDWRYVQTIEQENRWLHEEIWQLRTALIKLDRIYEAEAAKVRAFTTNVESNLDL